MTSYMLLSCIALAGCATKDYGTLAPLDAAAAPANCAQLDAHVAEVQQFRDRVQRESEFSGADVLAFLIDFGIGNAMAKDAAVKSADARLNQLNMKGAALGCREDARQEAGITPQRFSITQ